MLAKLLEPRRKIAAFGEVTVVDNDARDAILQAARAVRADLIVIGTHGRRGLSRVLLGSVAEDVLRRAPCPVLAVRARRPSHEAHPRRPRRLASAPPTVLAAAARLAELAHSKLILFRAISVPSDMPREILTSWTAAWRTS